MRWAFAKARAWPRVGDATVVRCDVRHDYELTVPVGNAIVYKLGQVFLSLEEADPSASDHTGLARPAEYNGEPHIVNFKASCELVRPWKE